MKYLVAIWAGIIVGILIGLASLVLGNISLYFGQKVIELLQ